MLQAIAPDACWNDPTLLGCDGHPEWHWVRNGFLRPHAVLAVVMITDEVECSVLPQTGYDYFTDNHQYWETSPDGQFSRATSAVCWNAGVVCDDADGDGAYESCMSRDNTDVLRPTSRYIDYLQGLRKDAGKEVVMLGILGVPPVTAHNEDVPHEPIEGGVLALTYRDWEDGEYPAGDILPDEWANGVTAADKVFDFGHIGPGCTGQNMAGDFTGQAIAPTRIIEVCESLDYEENGETQVRCCIESICDEDFSKAIDCLTGILQTVRGPAD